MVPKKLWSLGCALLLLAACGAPENRWRERIAAASAAPCVMTGTLTLEGALEPMGLTVTRQGDGLTIELTAPPELAGLRVDFAEETARLEHRGLVMNLPEGELPEQSVFTALKNLLSQLPEPEPTLTRRGTQLVQTGHAGLSPYAILWNEKEMKMEQINLPGAGAVITITDFIIV
ncbi:MAG: hypothetical protein RR022_03715 [Angelakisella sp.]